MKEKVNNIGLCFVPCTRYPVLFTIGRIKFPDNEYSCVLVIQQKWPENEYKAELVIRRTPSPDNETLVY